MGYRWHQAHIPILDYNLLLVRNYSMGYKVFLRLT